MGKRKRQGKQNQKEKIISLRPDLAKEYRRLFIEKFGREPQPGDPILFDPSANEPTHMVAEVLEHKMLEMMHKANVRPEIIYAFQKTGRLVTEENHKKLSKAELKEWGDAVDEWRKQHGGP